MLSHQLRNLSQGRIAGISDCLPYRLRAVTAAGPAVQSDTRNGKAAAALEGRVGVDDLFLERR